MRGDARIDQLVQRAKHADRDAFGRLYDALLPRVYRFVFFRVNSQEDAEDLTEQIFVRIFERITEYEDRGLPFEAWVFRIARNMVTDYYRKRHIHTVPIEEAAELPSETPTPEDITVQKLRLEEVHQALTHLPDSYREIIVLTYIQDHDTTEISMILDKPVAHVRVLQSRALHRLREIIHEYQT